MSYTYLGLLAFSLIGTGLFDFKWKMALFHNPVRAVLTLAVSVAYFLIWDVAGIALGIFFTGSTGLITGIMLAPNLPLEEPLFLLLLCYCALLLFVAFTRRFKR